MLLFLFLAQLGHFLVKHRALFRRHVFALDVGRFADRDESRGKKKDDADQQVKPQRMDDADAMAFEEFIRQSSGFPKEQSE